MSILPNSRKLNGVSPAEYLQEKDFVTSKDDDQFDYSIGLTRKEQEVIVRKKYHNNKHYANVKKQPVSKSLKSFFMKLRGANTQPAAGAAQTQTQTEKVNDNQSLLPPASSSLDVNDRRILVPCSTSSHSKHSPSHIRINRPKTQKKMISKSTAITKSYHSSTANNNGTFRRCNRHTLDFSTFDSGVLDHQILRRANSLCNSSIYSTFASPQQINTTFSMSSASSASSSSASASSASLSTSSSSCISNDKEIVSALDDSKQEQQIKKHEHKHEGVAASTALAGTSALAVDNRSDQEEQGQEEALQKRLWLEDVTLCPKEEIAEFLGSPRSSRSRVLLLYMSNFDFANQRLDNAFRALCSKLYLKAESQQLDRIIEAFAKRYYECNPATILQCFDVVYAVAYSLLLLNTDLHVVNDWTNKMTRSSFIKNTMETVQSLVFPHLADNSFSQQRKRRVSLVSHQSMDSSSYHLKRNDSSPSTISYLNDDESPNNCESSSHSISSASSPITPVSNLSQKFDAFKTNISRKSSSVPDGLTRTQKTWLADVEGLLKEMYAAVKSHRIDQAEITVPAVPAIPGNAATTIQRSRTLPKNTIDQQDGSVRRSRRRRGQSVIMDSNHNPVDDFLKVKDLPLLPTRKEDLFKQGLVMRKHVMESTDKRARNRQWQLCYLVIKETELVMYKPTQQHIADDSEKGRRRKSTSMMLWNPSTSFSSLQDIVHQHPHWQADEEQAPLATLEMNHTYTTAIPPPGWNPQRPHVFRLETGDGGLWLFESTDLFAVQAWVEACNLTAAKISKGPLPGAISNIDYGWGAKWDNTTRQFTDVPVWHSPAPCMINSTLDIREQCLDIEAQINELNKQLNEHRELKLSVDKKFGIGHQACVNSMQALTNWDRKLHFILHDLIKLRCYKDILNQKQLEILF